jgi:hypothetical protein
MNPPDPNRPDENRPFPSESEWLDLPLPEARPEAPATTPSDSAARRDRQRPPADDFVARTLQALAEERELDRQLQHLDVQLPGALLQHFAAPAPSRQFADRTLAALDDARRQHWQRLLARHVAPEPSPQFVARTLQALANAPGTPAQRPRPQAGPTRPRAGRDRTRRPLLLAAAAIAAIGWFAWSRQALLPLEVRFAARGSAAFAFHHGGSPLAAVLDAAAAEAEPWALPAAGADGLWLALAEAR